MNKIYQYEIGVLLDKSDEEYEIYSQVWDKKHGYYNTDWGIELTLEDAKQLIQDYVNNGAQGSYGIISEVPISNEIYNKIIRNVEENGYFSDYVWYDADYSLDNVIYSLTKDEENFVKRGE